MDVTQLESKITPKTKAILVVHMYGLPVDMDPVIEICTKYNLLLIEDAAEMHGQTYKGKKCGSFGDVSIFSFYPNKIITTGEGGMIVTNNEELSLTCQKLRNLAFEPNGRRFVHHDIGWNYRMTNMQAALGLAQLENIEIHIQKKRKIGELYFNGLSKMKNVQLPLRMTEYATNIYWVFGMVADTELNKELILENLNSNNIGTRPFFWCMHEQPIFNSMGLFINEKYPVAEKLARNGFYIPSGLGISDEEINFVISKLL